MVRYDEGELGCEFWVGGGMGRTPMIAVPRLIPCRENLAYCEAFLRVYNRYGRRDNKYKARIKILVHEFGKEEYTRQVEAEFAVMKRGHEPPQAELDRIKGYFADPAFEPRSAAP